jgi:hypothetical protein
MTASRDPDRLIHAFLNEGLDELPDPVYDAVRDRVEQTRQRTFIGPWRTSNMNRLLKIGLAAAAVVVVAVIGFNLLPGSPAPGAEPSATSEPTATPIPEPSVATGLAVGSSYAFFKETGRPSIDVTIPVSGWSAEAGSFLVKDGNCCAPDGASVLGTWGGQPFVPSDPCHWASTMPDTPATTLEEIAAALASQATRDASAPADVTVDGHPGTSITLHVPADIAYGANGFTDCDEGKFCTLSTDNGAVCSMWYHAPDEFSELWIVDVDGEFMIVTGNYLPQTPAAHVEEVRAILGSMVFTQ